MYQGHLTRYAIGSIRVSPTRDGCGTFVEWYCRAMISTASLRSVLMNLVLMA